MLGGLESANALNTLGITWMDPISGCANFALQVHESHNVQWRAGVARAPVMIVSHKSEMQQIACSEILVYLTQVD